MTSREEAQRLYVEENKTVQEIAQLLNCATGTVYRYKASDEEEGQKWDELKNLYNLTPSALCAMYSQALKKTLLEVNKNPDLILQPGSADAITKNIKNLQRLNPGNQYLGVVIDFIKNANDYLGEKDPSLQKKMKEHWNNIKERLADSLNKDRVFL